jgi:spore maturation protein CgeB
VSKLRILYLGAPDGTCLDRANAYRRLGHEVTHLTPRDMLPASPWIDRIIWRLGGAFVAPWVGRALRRALKGKTFDLCHVDNGECITPAIVALLRRRCGCVINYNIDDPFGRRDWHRFSAYRAAVPHYDMVVVIRELNVPEAQQLGASRVLCVHRSADEVSHAPVAMTPADLSAWSCEVLFLGTWMPERGPFLAELLRLGVPLTIRGARWQHAPEWPQLAAAYKGGPVFGTDYAKAIQGARINLGLLSKGNRDLHTTRSLEIPALGAMLCAERTSEHEAMYIDGAEAVFWSSTEECAQACRKLLADEPRRATIASAGHRRIHANGHFNEPTLQSILAELWAAPGHPLTAGGGFRA